MVLTAHFPAIVSIFTFACLCWSIGRTQLVVDFNNLPENVTISEDAQDGAIIYQVNATVHPDIPVSYKIEEVTPAAGTAFFDVDVTTGDVSLVSPSFDYEVGPNQYDINFTATEGSVTGWGVLTVNISNVIDPPTLSGLPHNLTFPEDQANTEVTVIYTVSATDPEGGTMTYTCSVEPDDGNFEGSCGGGFGQIRLIALPTFDYGTTPLYVMTINATSSTGAVSSDVLNIYIENTVNEVPVLHGLPATVNVSEITVPPQVLFTDFNGTDGDGDALTLETVFDPTSGSSKFSAELGAVNLTDVLDYETEPTVYTISMRVCDAQNCSEYSDLTVFVEDGVDEPLLSYTADPIEINESVTVPHDVGITWNSLDGQDETTFTWAIVPGTGFDTYFNIDSATGALSLVSAVDYEDNTTFPNHEMTVYVEATNLLSYSSVVNVSLVITDAYECPPVFAQSTYSGNVSDGDSSGVIATLEVTDCDVGDSVTFSVEAPGDTFFSISPSGSNGTLELTSAISRATHPTITFNVTATDSIGMQSTAEVTVTVSDVGNRAPNFTATSYHVNIPSTTPVGSILTTVTATDPDTPDNGDTVNYYMSDNDTDSSLFYVGYIDGGIGTAASLDPGVTYSVNVYAQDNFGAQSELVPVTITTFDPTPYLVKWEIDTNGASLSNRDIETFKSNVAATCSSPCTVNVADYYEDPDTRTYFLEAYITDSTDPLSTDFRPKEDVLSEYTTDGVSTPTTQAAGVVPTLGTVVSIGESISSVTTVTTVTDASSGEKENWWTDTTPGVVTLTFLVLIGLGLLILLVVIIGDVVWWSKRHTTGGYKTQM